MNRIVKKIALFVAATFITAGVWAQDRVKANIPFDFSVDNRTLPAGTYTISSEPGSHLVYIAERNSEANMWSTVLPDEPKKSGRDVLVFHRYGDRYFLSEIRCAECAMNSHLLTSKSEKRARTQTQEAALLRGGDVLIALK